MRPSRRGALALGAGFTLLPLAAGAKPATRSLKDAAARRGLIYGAAVEPEALERDSAFAALVRSQCAAIVPENVMKWNALRPAPTVFDFDRADRLMAWAAGRNMKVRGHCLVWHEATPAWLPKALDRSTAIDLLQAHISRVVGRYAGRIWSWDVVIEFVERADRRADGLRRSVWLEAIGPEYLSLSLRTAHAADPAARLTLEDYGLEYDDVPWMVEKRQSMLPLLHGLKQEGAPLHALGLQAHLDGNRPPAFGPPLRKFLRDVADLGLEIYITELDVNDQEMPGDAATRDIVIADIYRRFLDVVLDEPAVKMVNTWGLSDRYSSKSFMFPRADRDPVRPLPFDGALRPKAAALAMLDAFAAAPERRG